MVTDPRTDYDVIYGEDYYRGLGADRLIDYAAEFLNRPMGRENEYRELALEIARLSQSFGTGGRRWLDFGSGLGGFVRAARDLGIDAIGHDVGFGLEWMKTHGIPCIDETELHGSTNSFDVVVSIDVFEHITDPWEPLSVIRRALRPGGILVMLTADASRPRESLATWRYSSVPEIHVSFFTPDSWRILLRANHLEPVSGAFHAPPAMVHHRVRKNLPALHFAIPESVVAPKALYRWIDRTLGMSSFAIGIKTAGG